MNYVLNCDNKEVIKKIKDYLYNRDDIAHGYDVPKIEAIIDYYESNKVVYKEYIDNISFFKGEWYILMLQRPKLSVYLYMN